MQREVARLQGKLRAMQERTRLHGQKKKLGRKLHPHRTRFSDFVKAQFTKNKGIAFKEAVRLAKKAYKSAS
jgi:hypothetical protein